MGCPLHFYDDDRPRSPPFISYPFRTAHHLLFSAKVDARMGCVYARFTKDPDRSRVHFYYLKNFVRQKSRILATGCRTDRTPSSNLSLRIRSYLIVKRKNPEISFFYYWLYFFLFCGCRFPFADEELSSQYNSDYEFLRLAIGSSSIIGRLL